MSVIDSSPWAITRPTVRITNCRPLAQIMIAGWAIVVVGGRSGTLFRLSVAAAAVAATTAFVFDDPGAETVAASPSSLARRRLHRAGIAVCGVGVWWVIALLLARQRGRRFERALSRRCDVGGRRADRDRSGRLGGGVRSW